LPTSQIRRSTAAGRKFDRVAGRGLARQWHAFVSAIHDGTNLADDGLHVVACIEAAFRASWERRDVAVG
jgi:phthalate 4,5-cis-dihydrodiol dehydrogenase